jgi:pyruvate formate lyase activating enzyme
VSEEGVVTTDRNRCTACGTCFDACAAEARAVVGKLMTPEEVIQEVLRDRVFFDQSNGGVTFSGGEPLMQHEFLCEALQKCKIHRLHSAVDTTGFTSSDIINKIADVADLFLYDIKTLDDEVHRRYTGVSNERILANLRLLADRSAAVVVRIPLIPDVNTDADSIHKIGAFVKSLGSITEIQLLPYHESGTTKYSRIGKEPKFESVRPPSREQIQSLVDIARSYVTHVSIGG